MTLSNVVEVVVRREHAIIIWRENRINLALILLAKRQESYWTLLYDSLHDKNREHNDEDRAKSQHKVTLVSQNVLQRILREEFSALPAALCTL